MFTGGIRAGGSGDNVKRIVLKDKASYGPWKAKITSVLDAEECWDIVCRLEVAPVIVAPRTVDRVVVNREEVAESRAALKDFNTRSKKAASLITQTIDDSLVMSLDVFDRDPCRMWEKIARDFNTVTASQSHIARREFLSFKIRDDEGHPEAKHRYEELLRRVKIQGGEIEDDDKLLTLLGALPAKFDMLKEAFHARENQPDVEFI